MKIRSLSAGNANTSWSAGSSTVAPEALQEEMVLHLNEIKRQSQQLPHAKISINQSAAHMNFTGLCVVSVSNFNQAMAHINAHQLYTERGSFK